MSLFFVVACELLTEQVIAIFGPDSTAASAQALWVSHQYKIPYMLAQWDLNQPILNYTINLHPHYENVGKALGTFLKEAEDWNQLGLIYAHDDSKLVIQTIACLLRFFSYIKFS